jgi:hypothetical protein
MHVVCHFFGGGGGLMPLFRQLIVDVNIFFIYYKKRRTDMAPLGSPLVVG